MTRGGYSSRRRNGRPLSRRQFLRRAACATLALTGVGALDTACAPLTAKESESELPGPEAALYRLPNEDGSWVPEASHTGDLPSGAASIEIDEVGALSFDASQVKTTRPDIFRPGNFSLYDVLSHLDAQGELKLDAHFDPRMNTHVIDAINGESGWWYEAYYSAGWAEDSVFRMDMYPYKNRTRLRLRRISERRLDAIYRTFEDEVARRQRNGGRVILPKLQIQGPGTNWSFADVEIVPHGVRSDLFQDGVVTALDALLSLGEQGEFSTVRLTWYERIGRADPVDHYFVEGLDDIRASGGCGFVYEIGPEEFSGFAGAHIHVPSDARAIVSPEYAFWFWICL